MVTSFKIRLKLKFDWLQNSCLFHCTSLFLDIFLFVTSTHGREHTEQVLTQMGNQFWITTEISCNTQQWLFMPCNWEYRYFSLQFYISGFPKHVYSIYHTLTACGFLVKCPCPACKNLASFRTHFSCIQWKSSLFLYTAVFHSI